MVKALQGEKGNQAQLSQGYMAYSGQRAAGFPPSEQYFTHWLAEQ